MSIVLQKHNALTAFINIDASEEFESKLSQLAMFAWETIGQRKEIIALGQRLCIQRDENKNPVKILPIPDPDELGIEITKEENISLAIIEIYFYLTDVEEGFIPQENTYCLLLNIGELMSELIAIKAIRSALDVGSKHFEEFLKTNHFPLLDKFFLAQDEILDKSSKEKAEEYFSARKERNNLLMVEIIEIVRHLKESGRSCGATNVWNELKKRVEQQESCCSFIDQDPSPKGRGTAIYWFDANGLKKHLTYRNLKERLRQQKIKRIVDG